ncbi:protein jag [Ornithinimicrobium sp. Y1694]|uniref:Jag family protein n=1 Tax=Ornithinimicrobium sp. Y1694 TaxID=3418590 RepID=UPI003CEE85B9
MSTTTQPEGAGQESAVAESELNATESELNAAEAQPAAETQATDETQDTASATESTRTQTEAQEELIREGEIAADFLEALLDIADLSGDLEVDVEGNRAAVAIVDSEDGVAPRRLVGPGGQVLDALQELTRLAVQAETGDRSRLMLDVAGYRSDRRAALVNAARAAIAEVKQSGERRELEPMTAFERKVVHDEVLAAGLHSESEGAEPARYVVIQPSA